MRRLYLETSEAETREIDKALLCDSDLQRQYKELAEMKKHLGDVEIQPSENSLQKILAYAKGLRQPSR